MYSTVFRVAQAARTSLTMAAGILAAFSLLAPVHAGSDTMLEPVIVTATRTPQIAADVLSDTVVITAEEIARSGQTSLVDLLQKQRSVEITRNGGSGANASVFIRGAENKQNVVLVDGVRIGSSTSGGATWSNIPLSQVDRIEIVYGPLSSLYGADAMGGVVQIFTRKGAGAVSASASVMGGSHGARSAQAGVSGSLERVRFALSAAHEAADGISSKKPGASGYNPDRDGYARDSASGRLDFEVVQGHELGASFLRSRMNAEYDNSPVLNDHTVHTLDTYALTSKNKLTPDWTSHVQLARAYDESETFTTSRSRFDTKQTHISWQNDVRLGTGDVLQLLLERRQEEVGSSTAALNRERDTNSAAAAYQLKRGAHLASFSLRKDDNSQFGSHTTGSAAYGYRIAPSLRANASVGTSFRAPSFNELYFPNFGFAGNQPERGRNAELGLTYETGDTHLSAVYYHNRIRDLIVTARPCPATAAPSCAYNVNKALLTGVSLSGSTRVGDFVYRASLDLQDPKDETTGLRLARRARAHGALALEYDIGSRLAGVEAILSGNRFDNAANSNRLGGYGLLNLYTSVEFARNWSFFGRWNNVFNKNYELARNYSTEGSSVFVGVRYAR